MGDIAVARRARGPIYPRLLKRSADVVLATLAVVVLAPVALVVAALVLLSLGRPVLYRQTRIGLAGRPFVMLKFRTMRPDRRKVRTPVATERRRYHKSRDDPRHTRVGRLLRRSSLDELPQLVNVLRGEMSLIGPRPELPHVVAGYAPWEHERHRVRPGLTGLWQISARGEGHMHHYTHLDVQYVRTLSFRNDLWLALRTVPALLRRRGH
jgi:lipopolysaccharide/colanic/teichoic acid biosynthesis glycosyltransferase